MISTDGLCFTKLLFMKAKNLFSILFAGTLALGMSSCKKTSDTTSNTEVETTYELSEDQAIADNLTEDSYDVMNEAVEGLGLSGSRERLISNNNLLCANVTVSPASGFPRTITIDFGTGCTIPGSNITRRGIIQVVISDSLRIPGSTSVMTFQNYFVNNFKKEGTITWTNTSTPGNRSWRREVVNGKITAPSGRFWTHNGVKNVVQTAGVSTPRNLLDDEFSITGTGTTTNSNNVSRSHTILIALVKKTICENIVSGRIRFDGPNHTAVLDYGDGTCDRLATISIDGGTPRTILLGQ